MDIFVDPGTDFKGLEKGAAAMAGKGFKTIMIFHAEGGIDKDPDYKRKCDSLLKKFSDQGVHIFGGIFPGIVDDGKLMEKGSIMTGLACHTQVVTLEGLGRPGLETEIERQLQLTGGGDTPFPFKTVFVFGDGFGESNLNLIDALNRFMEKHPIKVVGGLAGRASLKASHYNIFSPEKAIQNGAVLAFTDLESGIGVKHGWLPLPKSQCTITATNHCYVEKLNKKPALTFYLDLISQFDPAIAKEKQRLMSGDSDLIFKEVAIRYPLGLIRRQQDGEQIIDRTPVSVGADKSLQFSAEIPEGTQACILHLKGGSQKAQCLNIREAAQSAYLDSLRLFPIQLSEQRVMVMDCFGRKQMVEQLNQNYESTEFGIIAGDQKDKPHSPFGVLTFGEISSMEAGYVELHNKTAVVATVEDR